MNILVQWHYFMTLELKRMWELFIKGKCFLKKEMFSNGKFSKPCLIFYLIILSSWTFQPSSSSSSLIIICLVFKCIFHRKSMYVISSVQSLSRVQLFVTPQTAAHQASLSIINSWSLLKLMSIGRWCHPTISSSAVPFSCFQSFPASESFPRCQFFPPGGQNIGVSASTSVLPMNIQDWFPLGLTGLISLQSKGLSRVFFNTTVQKHQFFSSQLSL